MLSLRWSLLLSSMLCLTLGLAQAAAPPTAPPIRVEVRFTVKEFQPKGARKGALECVVHNGTEKPVKVPTGYASGFDSDVVIFGQSARGFLWEMRLVRRRLEGSKPSFAQLRPGQSLVVFKADLNELLIERKGVGWSWQA